MLLVTTAAVAAARAPTFTKRLASLWPKPMPPNPTGLMNGESGDSFQKEYQMEQIQHDGEDGVVMN